MSKDIKDHYLFKAGYKDARNNMRQYGWVASVELYQMKVMNGVNHLPEDKQIYIRGMHDFVYKESEKRKARNKRNMKKYLSAKKDSLLAERQDV